MLPPSPFRTSFRHLTPPSPQTPFSSFGLTKPCFSSLMYDSLEGRMQRTTAVTPSLIIPFYLFRSIYCFSGSARRQRRGARGRTKHSRQINRPVCRCCRSGHTAVGLLFARGSSAAVHLIPEGSYSYYSGRYHFFRRLMTSFLGSCTLL